MTIFNTNNNVSEDYTFIMDTAEVFYDKETIPTGIFIYGNGAWNECETTDNDFDTQYDNIIQLVANQEYKILDVDDDFELLLEEDSAIYIGIKTQDQSNFPEISTSQYFATIINTNIKACIPIKTLKLENINVVDIENSDYSPSDYEYLSAKQALKVIKKEIEKIELFHVVSDLNQITNPKANVIYFVPKEIDTSDGLNWTFDLYIYNPDYTENSQMFIKIDQLQFDINNYAPKMHRDISTIYGVGTKTLYGHTRIIDNLNASNYTDGDGLSAHQGYVLKEQIDNIPVVDVVDNLTTNDATKALSAKQGKALNDLIGSAITYINQ